MKISEKDMYVFMNRDLMFVDVTYDITRDIEEAMTLYTLDAAKIIREELDEPEEWAIVRLVRRIDLEEIVEGKL